jgi:gluconate 2-dehydrogenase gamma chain
MPNDSISRRDILRTLAVGALSGSVLQVIPAEAAAYIHQAVHKEKSASPAGNYAPKYFSAAQYATLIALCDAIIPKDEKSGGAVEAGAPEFIDLLTSENEEYQLRLGGGLFWLDGFCTDHYGKVFLDCAPEQKKEVLDLIAFRKNAKEDPSLSQGVSFFAFLRNMTCDGYYTSKIGIADLGYIGNTSLREFPGCPPLPE